MKRILLFLIIFSFCSLSAFTYPWENIEDHSSYSDYLARQNREEYLLLTPYYGARGGINIVDSNYNNVYSDGTDDKVYNWSDSSGTLDRYTDPFPGAYSDAEMIAMGGVYDITPYDEPGSFDEPLTVTITCPNDFYLVSQSNPAYKRPFEIILRQSNAMGGIKSEHRDLIWNDDSSTSYDINGGRSEPMLFSEPISEDLTFDYDLAAAENSSFFNFTKQDAINGSYNNGDTEVRVYCGFWFDLIINLPMDSYDAIRDAITVDGVTYPLIEANDYTAIVTITISYEGRSKSITIPFSGYYDRGSVELESTASLIVDTYASAGNLSIESDRGVWVPVGKMDFMAFKGTEANQSTMLQWSNPKIFISSSSDPTVNSTGEFKLVHTNVRYDTPLTDSNSIGFTVRARSLTSGGNTAVATFRGEDTISSITGTGGGGISVSQIASYSDAGNINNITGGHQNASLNYYSYSGEIDVMLDPGDNIMYEGVYKGNMYIHVIGER